MNALITCDRRFKKTPNGNIWTTSLDDYSFWLRYISVFDKIIIFARADNFEKKENEWKVVNGKSVDFFPIPNYIGPWQFLLNVNKIRKLAKSIMTDIDVAILRAPSHIALIISDILKKANIPYGVEVIGDPAEAFSPGGIPSFFGFVLKIIFTNNLKKICKEAKAVSYVTKETLQKKYPPSEKAFVTNYSSIDLMSADIVNKPKEHPSLLNELKIVSVGSFEQKHKGFSDIILATKILEKKGLNFKVFLIGGGSKIDNFKKLVNKLSLSKRVIFVGELPGSSEVLKFIREMDLFISASRTEGLPRVVIEAMSQGLPCIASNVGGTKELLSSEWLFERGNVDQLVNKIIKIISSKELYENESKKNILKSYEYIREKLQTRREEMYRYLRDYALKNNRKDIHYFCFSPGIISLRTNLKKFSFPFGISAKKISYEEYKGSKLKIELYKKSSVFFKLNNENLETKKRKYHYFYLRENEEVISYERNFLFGRKLLLNVKKIKELNPVLCFNSDYYNFIRFRFMNIHSIDFILSDITAYCLLKLGYCPLHCGSFNIGKKTILIFAPPNTGKTLTVKLFCERKNANYIAEDIAITDGKNLYSVPFTSTFRYYPVEKDYLNVLFNKISKKIPFFEIMGSFVFKRTIYDFFPNIKIIASSVPDYIIFLEQGYDSYEEVPKSLALRKISNLNRFEFNYLKSPILAAFEYLNNSFEIKDIFNKEIDIINQLVNGTKYIFSIYAKSSQKYYDLLLRIINECNK